MRVVLDTNVLVSAALKRQSMPGLAAHLADHKSADEKLSSVAERAAMRRNQMQRRPSMVH